MSDVYLVVLLVLSCVPLAEALRTPAKIYTFPYFMAFTFLVFIVPQAIGLVRFPGFVRDESVEATLLMACLCLVACFVGYQLSPSYLVRTWVRVPVQRSRLFRVGIVFIIISYTMRALLDSTELEFDDRGMTGTGTILLYFYMLVYPGFAICLDTFLEKATVARLCACILGVIPPLMGMRNGSREGTAMLVLIIAMALYFKRRVSPPSLAILGSIVLAIFAIPSIAEYRQLNVDGRPLSFENLHPWDNLANMMTQESNLELRNGAAVIESTRMTGRYQLGKGYWNHMVFRFVPGQLVGRETKQSLMFDGWDLIKEGESETGTRFIIGTTVTSMGDAFLQFGWFGWIFFIFAAVVFKGLWTATHQPNALMAQLLYALVMTSGMRAVTHWTLDFLPGLCYHAIALGFATLYARDRRPAQHTPGFPRRFGWPYGLAVSRSALNIKQ